MNSEIYVPKVRRVVDSAFANRLEKACDQHLHVPPKNHGRLGYIINKFQELENDKISGETVRKWFYGESRPRPAKMRTLARVLEVPIAWLSLGDAPEMDGRARHKRDIALGGAVDLVAAIIQMDGGTVSFAQDKDPRSRYVHMYAIIKGATYAIHAAFDGGKQGMHKFLAPTEYLDCFVIGVIRTGGTSFDLIEVATEAITTHGISRGGYLEVGVVKNEEGYFAKLATQKTKLTSISSFTHRL